MKKKEKVAIFVDGIFIPSYSGAANRFHFLSKNIQKYTNTDIVVILCDRGWSDPVLIKKESFTTYIVHPKLFKDKILLEEILTKENVDILQFSTLELIIELGIPLAFKLKKYLIFESHYDDLEFAKSVGIKKEQLKEIEYFQNTFGKYFDKVISLSGEDNITRNLKIKKEKIEIIPSGVELDDFKTNCFDLKSKKILFFGNLFFDVNLESLRLIKAKIYPKLKEKGFNFSIVGDISKKDKEYLEDENFSIVGKVDNLQEHFKDTTFALAPVLHGTGIRIKILNYLNAGIPTITTSQGARGFPKKDMLIIRDNLDEYPELISDLITNKVDSLRRISLKERDYIRKNMSWEKTVIKISNIYSKLMTNRKTNKSRALEIIKNIDFKEPSWIKDVIRRKRFKRNKTYVKLKDRFIKIN